MSSDEQPAGSRRRPDRRNDRGAAMLAGGGLVAVLALLYLIPAANLGFWEPWETSLATLGRYVAVTDGVSAFAPIRDDVLIARPWLQTALLSLGYSLGGGSEFGFRLPLALLMIAASLTGFVVLRRFFGTLRAFASALLFAACPIMLLSASNLAGTAVYEAPLTITVLAMAALVGEWERARAVATIALGPLLALCLWAGGAVGFATPIAIAALYALGSRDESYDEDPGMIPALLGGVLLLAGLGIPVALAMTSGWEANKDLVGLGATMVAPVGLLIAAAPGSRARFLFHPIYTPIAVVLFAIVAAPPLLALNGATQSFEELGAALLYQDFLTGRVLPEHVTFDVLVRLVGASAFPAVILVPFGFAYLFRSYDGPADETDDPLESARAVKQLLTVWMAVGFMIFGLSTSLAGNYSFPVAFPMTAAVGLALGDVRFRRAFTNNRVAFYMAGLASFLLLAMTSKDIRGTFNEDLGRPGPHVVFERLLTDGAVEFPHTYAFENIQLFMLVWTFFLVLIFAEPIANLSRLGVWVGEVSERIGATEGRLGRVLRKPLALVARIGALKSRVFLGLSDRLAGVWGGITRQAPTARIALVGFVVVTTAWSFHLAFVDVPNVTDHLSQKGMMDTFHELGGEDPVLHVAGIDASDNSYYLGEGQVERLDRVSDLRDLFCGDARVFAVVPFDSLAEAHYSVRNVRDEESEDPCDAAVPFHVVDGRSSRYVLLSNQLHEDRGETEQSVIAENVFTRETLPETATLIEDTILVDGKLRLVAVELPAEPIDSGEFDVVAYWEVLERPSSNYEAFIHVDFAGNRLNGDHDPVHGYYPMRYWVPGEIVRDSYPIEVSRADRAGEYSVYYGFFRGDDRLAVTGGASENRVPLGTVTIK